MAASLGLFCCEFVQAEPETLQRTLQENLLPFSQLKLGIFKDQLHTVWISTQGFV